MSKKTKTITPTTPRAPKQFHPLIIAARQQADAMRAKADLDAKQLIVAARQQVKVERMTKGMDPAQLQLLVDQMIKKPE